MQASTISVIDRIAIFPDSFEDEGIDPVGNQRFGYYDQLDGAFTAVYWFARNGGTVNKSEQDAMRFYRESEHYLLNISILRRLIDEQARNNGEKQIYAASERLRLDFEMLLSNIRSYLDSVIKMAAPYANPDDKIPTGKFKSFGKFAVWVEHENPKLTPPINYFQELVPWGLTLRKLRDDLLHHARRIMVFGVGGGIWLNPDSNSSPEERVIMPEEFYVKDHANKLIDLQKFMVYLVTPAFALKNVLGEFFSTKFQTKFPQINATMFSPILTSSKRVFDWLSANKEILKPQIYQNKYV